jgi:hypothetical protein
LKQAARENDGVRLEAVLNEWGLEMDTDEVLEHHAAETKNSENDGGGQE